MNPTAASIFPNAGIRKEGRLSRLMAEGFQKMEQFLIASVG
jgi:hypothetical protein